MIISPQDCCRPCDDTTTTNIPGPQGDPGTPGTDGTDGVNAYTTVTIPFIMPALAGTVTVDVAVSSWAVVGQKVVIGLEGSAAFGTFQVVSIVGPTQLLLQNVSTGTTATDSYADNSAPGTLFPSALQVGPSGLQGPTGAAGATGAPDDAKYILQVADGDLPNAQNLDALATGLMKNTTGTGVVSIVAIGVANTNVAPVNAAGGLSNGNVVFGTATGVETKTPAATRNAIGLAKGIADTNTPQVDDGAGLTNGEILRATAAGIESVSNATIQAQLGITGGVGAWLVFQNIVSPPTGGGNFASGAWRTVPLNTEVVDTSAIGSIAGNTITLPAGTYRVRWSVPAFSVDQFQSRLWNATAGSVFSPGGYGSIGFASVAGYMDSSLGETRITLAGVTNITIEALCTTTNADGFGPASLSVNDGVYAMIEFEKEL